MKLKLNEEQQGLKLIQVNNGFVIIKTTFNPIESHDKYVTTGQRIWKWDVSMAYVSNNTPCEIIFATPNLNLEGVPEIEEKDIENIKKVSLQNNEFWRNGGDYDTFELGFIQGYKQAQQILFTLDDVKKLFAKSIEVAPQAETHTRMISDVEYRHYVLDTLWIDAVLPFAQSLKQPTVEIIFEENQCDGCKSGYPLRDGIHHVPYPSGSMSCQKHKYTKPVKAIML